VEELAPHPVVFRTCDLGADKLMPGDVTLRSQNPALGLRALRLSLARPADFRIQLRAILRAAAHGTVRVMFPMVATVAELRQAKAHLAAVRQELIDAGVSHGDPEIGVVVEVPSAAIRAEQLARECDFFSVGTNDLVQYTLALDRLNPWVADLARNLDPAVLRLIEMTVTAARRAHRRPPSICGDMASDPLALPLVVGLGVRCLSTPFTAVPLVRETVRRLRADEAARVAQAALGLDDAASVEALVRREFAPVLGDLWEEQGLAV
ncbi:MAG TPA: putative PEP-binding protein, partial [Polyangiaceae bacterium LLY-WYZ-14_1]|nr:putative PEP-binding protein [Polyangiaceae bacterium LLY-WYZ-14_1]